MSLQDSHQISDVKVMLVKGIDGNGIASIEKTSTQGLVDVYTITYTNGEKTTFTVTNGASGGMSAQIFIVSDADSDVSVTAPSGRSLPVTLVSGSSTLWQCETTEYGVHEIVSVLNSDIAQASVNVDICQIYTVEVLHFFADITVTYPANATCTCGLSGETPVDATENPNTFRVHLAGTYVVTVTNGIYTKTENVVIDTNEQVETLTISLIPDGATVTPTDDVTTLLYCADIWDSEYTTIAEILADSTILSAIISSNNAMDYMARSTTWASTVCANQSAMSLIGLNNYASDVLVADSTWSSAVLASAYKSSVLNANIPYMTSNVAPSGVASSSTNYPDIVAGAYMAFRGYGGWLHDIVHNSSGWAKYMFPEPILPKQVILYTGSGHNNPSQVIQASVDGTTWVNLYSVTVSKNTSYTQNLPSNQTKYQYFRIYSYNNSSDYIYLGLQVIGRKDV